MRNIYFALVVTGIVAVFGTPIRAQVTWGVHVNIGTQPAWGPVGYDEVQYYYLPDIDSYYDVPHHRYYYNEGGNWIYRSSLPPRFHNYNLYNGYKVVVNEREPWRNHEANRAKYASFKGRHDQQVIRDSRDQRYFVNKNHPEHKNWVQQQKHDNGRGNGKGNDNKHEGNNGRGNGNKHDGGGNKSWHEGHK